MSLLHLQTPQVLHHVCVVAQDKFFHVFGGHTESYALHQLLSEHKQKNFSFWLKIKSQIGKKKCDLNEEPMWELQDDEFDQTFDAIFLQTVFNARSS